MTKSPDESLRLWTLPAGNLVKVGGIPYELTTPIVVRGPTEPKQVVAHGESAERVDGQGRSDA